MRGRALSQGPTHRWHEHRRDHGRGRRAPRRSACLYRCPVEAGTSRSQETWPRVPSWRQASEHERLELPAQTPAEISSGVGALLLVGSAEVELVTPTSDAERRNRLERREIRRLGLRQRHRGAVAAIQASWRRMRRPASSSAATMRAKQAGLLGDEDRRVGARARHSSSTSAPRISARSSSRPASTGLRARCGAAQRSPLRVCRPAASGSRLRCGAVASGRCSSARLATRS
jgi:hypothetical protein